MQELDRKKRQHHAQDDGKSDPVEDHALTQPGGRTSRGHGHDDGIVARQNQVDEDDL